MDELKKAAIQENKLVYVESVNWMKLHFQEEKEIYYLAALLGGCPPCRMFVVMC